jgi:hypothetical protein
MTTFYFLKLKKKFLIECKNFCFIFDKEKKANKNALPVVILRSIAFYSNES